jgi:hypothetical protein
MSLQYVDGNGVIGQLTDIPIDRALEEIKSGSSKLMGNAEDILTDGLQLAEKGIALALPLLLSVIWTESHNEDIAKAREAAALYGLRMSCVWHPYADTIKKGDAFVPSWRSFVRDHLPLRYTTVTERTNSIDTYHKKLGWTIGEIADVGFAKLQTARHTVETQIAETGGIEPETERILKEETHEGVLAHVAGRNEEKVGFSFNAGDGSLWVHFPESVCTGVAMAQIAQFEFHVPDGVPHDVWQTVIYRVVNAVRATVEE